MLATVKLSRTYGFFPRRKRDRYEDFLSGTAVYFLNICFSSFLKIPEVEH